MCAVVHFVGMIRTCDDALTAGDTSFGYVAKLGFRVLPFGIVAPEATHGASFEEHGCADARAIVQGEALNVENNVSTVHGDTVWGESIANDAAVSAYAERARRSTLPFALLLVHLVFIRLFFAEIQDGKEKREETLAKSSGKMRFHIWNIKRFPALLDLKTSRHRNWWIIVDRSTARTENESKSVSRSLQIADLKFFIRWTDLVMQSLQSVEGILASALSRTPIPSDCFRNFLHNPCARLIAVSKSDLCKDRAFLGCLLELRDCRAKYLHIFFCSHR
jgi:hypothetical protein